MYSRKGMPASDMRTGARHLTTAPFGESARRAATWLLVLAFALQSYVTQIHIHHVSAGSSAIVKVLSKAPAPRSLPGDSGTQDCPLCQAVAHAGAFFAPVTPLLPLPVLWGEFLARATHAQTADGISTHDWHSRAPPLH